MPLLTSVLALTLFLGTDSVLADDPPFTVNTFADTVDANTGNETCADSSGQCALRAAVMELNALGGGTIQVPAVTYILTLGTGGSPGANSDDLDITADIIIQGAGSASSTIKRPDSSCNLNGTHYQGEFRLFHVYEDMSFTVRNLTLANGCADGSDGGAISENAGANVFLERTVVMGNRAGVRGSGMFMDVNSTLTALQTAIVYN